MIKSFRAAVFVVSVAAGAWSVSCGSSTGHGSGFEPPDASMSSGSSTGSGSSSGTGPSDGGPRDATSSGSFNDAPSLFGDSSGSVTDAPEMFDVQPSTLQTITVTAGQTMPGVLYKATLNGLPIKAAWTIDRGDLATIGAGPSTQATVLPTGTTGGLVNVIAGLNGQTLKRQVFIQLTAQQSGANPSAPGESAQVPTNIGQLGAGGGVGGVGGEGLGVAVTDPTTLAGLTNPTGTGQAQNLALLYPYDQTVFPRGLLAPLLQWDWTVGDADAIQITLRTSSGSFSWTGTFGRPAILMQTGGKFIRHPIPQDVWTMATNTAGGPTSNGMPDQLVLTLVVAKAGQGYGPLTETWTIAPGRLEGAIYYNSYGTALVKNSNGVDYYGHQYGAGTLGIQPGATSPDLVAGIDSPADAGDGTGCRVCHTVSGDGKTLVTQASDLKAATYAETVYINLANDTTAGAGTATTTKSLAFPAITKDGSLLLSGAGGMTTGDNQTKLYAMPAGTPVAGVTGLGTNFQGSLPAFSPDSKHVSFNFWSGSLPSGTTTLNSDRVSLGILDFDGVSAFSNARILYTPTGGASVTYSSFLPTSTGILFESELANPSGQWGYTWNKNTGELWWVDTATSKAHRLDLLNGYTPAGTNYLPTCDCDGGTGGAPAHTPAQDATLNYEPTVNPVASGGYAWVVFTSRRMYGNVAQIDPWKSDPRNYPWLDQVTDKKLWVAAIDLNATPGADASHPAFYLPAQELHAGNARGYWTVAPCRPDGQSCMSGDMCCGGYCEPGADGGLVCTNMPPNTNCSAPQEKCTTSADCCDSTNQCIDGFCSIVPR